MSKCNHLELQISEKLLQDTKDIIKRRIIQKLASARTLGKLEILKNVQNGKLPYKPDFRHHRIKFNKVKEYLNREKHAECFYLNECAYNSKAFDSEDFDTDIAADTAE
jgi:hypothetical protein